MISEPQPATSVLCATVLMAKVGIVCIAWVLSPVVAFPFLISTQVSYIDVILCMMTCPVLTVFCPQLLFFAGSRLTGLCRR